MFYWHCLFLFINKKRWFRCSNDPLKEPSELQPTGTGTKTCVVCPTSYDDIKPESTSLSQEEVYKRVGSHPIESWTGIPPPSLSCSLVLTCVDNLRIQISEDGVRYPVSFSDSIGFKFCTPSIIIEGYLPRCFSTKYTVPISSWSFNSGKKCYLDGLDCIFFYFCILLNTQ